ncbi:hypothetical protein GCM10010440_75910 [Kitasatospora cinereorecta]
MTILCERTVVSLAHGATARHPVTHGPAPNARAAGTLSHPAPRFPDSTPEPITRPLHATKSAIRTPAHTLRPGSRPAVRQLPSGTGTGDGPSARLHRPEPAPRAPTASTGSRNGCVDGVKTDAWTA